MFWEELNKPKCHVMHVCKGYPNVCSIECVYYHQLQIMYSKSNIPKKYQYDIQLKAPQVDYDKYVELKTYLDNIVWHVKEGHGLFIVSSTKGNGKTSWACKIANEYMKQTVKKYYTGRTSVLFVSVPKLLDELRGDMSKKEEDKVTTETVKAIHNADLVVWDDIGCERPSDWVREQLYIFINERETNLKSQIFTSNVPIEELYEDRYLGDRVTDRIVGQCRIIEFSGEGMRKSGVNW